MATEHFDLLTLSYGVLNAARLVSYAPQIYSVARDENGAAAISISCWLIWVGANGTTALYAWMKFADYPLALLNAFNAACCAAVLIITIQKRYRISLYFDRRDLLKSALCRLVTRALKAV